MGVSMHRRGLAAVALVAVAALTAAAGCSKSSNTPAAADTGPITLTVDVFGQFGYDDLYKQYHQQHPNVTIVERGTGSNLSDYTPKETQLLAAGSGAGDVMAIEEGTIVQMLKQSDKFVNLLNYGAADLQSNFLPYKWKQATTADGKSLIGLGSDIGGLAMCYRTDLFAKAGLPTDRDAVSAMWKNSWDDYIATGLKFKAANPGASFMDSATNNFNAILMQTAGKSPGYTYFDTSGKLVVDSNPAVKTAWNETNKMITDGLSAGLQSFADAWTNGFKQSKFATVACPAWMTGVISGDAGDAFKGKWDIATVPGGGGNWGGSFLAVPKQSKHQAAAVDLVKFLTSKEGQIAAWNAKGNLPSNPQAEQDSSVLGKTDPYFNNAPTGKIFATGAASLTPVYLGPANQAVRDQVENSLRSVEQGQKTADQAWTEALANASKAAQ